MNIAPQAVYIRAYRSLGRPFSVSSWTSWVEYSVSWEGKHQFGVFNDDL